MGLVGFLDDFIKIRKQRNLGLNKRMKFLGQTFVAITFGIGALFFNNADNLTPASTSLSYTRDLAFLSLGAVGFVILAWLLVAAWSNAVNFTDGLDGLAAGSSVMVLGTYVAIGFFQFRNACWAELSDAAAAGCYAVRDPLDLAVVAAAALGGCIGFLWWNAHPADVFMGDVGSLGLGGALGTVALLTKQELLLPIVGGVFVIEGLSVIIQVGSFKLTGKRVFRMAPLHHHFELIGWQEPKVIMRFLVLAILCALFSLTTLKLR